MLTTSKVDIKAITPARQGETFTSSAEKYRLPQIQKIITPSSDKTKASDDMTPVKSLEVSVPDVLTMSESSSFKGRVRV